MAKRTKRESSKKAPKKGARRVARSRFEVTVETGGQTYTVKAGTKEGDIANAILGLGLTMTNTQTLVKLRKGKLNSTPRWYRVPIARRLFSNNVVALTCERNLLQTLK